MESNMTTQKSIYVVEKKLKGSREWKIISYWKDKSNALDTIDPVFCDQLHYYRVVEFKRI